MREATARHTAPQSRHVHAERPARVLVHHVGDRHGGDYFDEVRRDAAVEAREAFALDYIAEHAAHGPLGAFSRLLCNRGNITLKKTNPTVPSSASRSRPMHSYKNISLNKTSFRYPTFSPALRLLLRNRINRKYDLQLKVFYSCYESKTYRN